MNERNAFSLPGLPLVLAFFVIAFANVAWLVDIARHRPAEPLAIAAVIVIFVLLFVATIGFFQVQPNQGAVLQLFGNYSGTVREAGLRQALLDLVAQVLGDFVAVAAQRGRARVVRVVGVARGGLAQRRLGLDVDEVLVVVDLEHGFGGVHHLPHHHGADFDRAAVQVVDLELAAFEVAHAQADLLGRIEGVVPAQALSFTVPTYLPNRLCTAAWLGSTM